MDFLRTDEDKKAIFCPTSAPWYPAHMSRIEEIKAAAADLDPEEQFELFRWWVESKAFKTRQLAALKRDIAAGIENLDSGRYQTYDATQAKRLAEKVGRSGRKRLKDLRKKT